MANQKEQATKIRDLEGDLLDASSYIGKLEDELSRRKETNRYLRKQLEKSAKFKKRVQLLITLALILNAGLIAANLCGLKIWRLYKIPVDGGIFIFPVTYVVGDLIVEIFHQRIANFVAGIIATMGVLMCCVMKLVSIAPFLVDFPGADNSAFVIVQSAMGRIFLASMLGFFLSQIVNNYVFERLRHHFRTKEKFLVRAIISSFPAHIVDALTFEIAAFIGKLSLADFAYQVWFALVAGAVLEACFSPLAKFLAFRLDPDPKKPDEKPIDEKL